jgi:histidinol-phosphate/aromatic aminotransferase/cobyric acid decarboxylase-like protein
VGSVVLLLLLSQPSSSSRLPQHTPPNHPKGIMVRHYAKKELSGFIRISVGKPEHTDALMAALDSL